MGIFDMFKKKNSSTIVISTAPEPEPTEAKINAIEEEEGICQDIMNRIKRDRPEQKYDWEIRHRSQDYTTLSYRNSDMIRVKWTEAARWIKVQVVAANAEKFMNDPIFEHQKKKTELMWKVPCITKDDIDKVYPYILEAWDYTENIPTGIQFTDTERAYVKAAADLIAEVTGDAEHTYIDRTTQNLRAMYHGSTACLVNMRPYKKKPWIIEYVDDGKSKTLTLENPEDIKAFKPQLEKQYAKFLEWKGGQGYIDAAAKSLSYMTKWEE